MSSQNETISRRALLSRGIAIAASAVAVPLVFHSRDAFAISREAVHYTDKSATAAVCAGCMSFIPAAQPGSPGGCYVLKGAISPAGHCDEWSPKK